MKIKQIALVAFVTALLTGCGGDAAVTANNTPAANTVCTGTEATTTRLFLQQLSDTSVIVKWRGDATAACIGTSASNLTTRVVATATAGDHKEAKFTGLTPDSAYFYSVGGAPTAPAAQTFRTAPTTGYPSNDGNTRIWVVGDSGTAGYLHSDTSATVATPTAYPGVADAVRQGMSAFTKTSGQAIDMLLMLGDNAYNNGDDANYQAAVFDTYKAELKNVALWPTIGNHEMGVVDGSALYGYPAGTVIAGGLSTSSNPNSYILDKAAINSPTLMPYLNIFSTPIAGEAGGIASGTKQYYSFNYGKVHVVSLDSQLSARDTTQRATMKAWLDRDLADASTKADWTIVIFHHPPYSKGANHDSDSTSITLSIDKPQIDMRNEFVPVFQKYGVDVVLNGHSHSYERSYYMKDLFAGTPGVVNGDSKEFVAATHAYGKGYSGRSAAGEEYKKTPGYVVYSAAGNGGKADHDYGSMGVVTEWLNHAANVLQPFWNWVGAQVAGSSKSGADHKRGLAIPGSVLIDANKDRLEVQMLNQTGQVLDQFLISKK
jgi:phosphodiesterase/alkaline phosphatase D-like protein